MPKTKINSITRFMFLIYCGNICKYIANSSSPAVQKIGQTPKNMELGLLTVGHRLTTTISQIGCLNKNLKVFW